MLDQKICMQNAHFLLDKHNKPTFHKNLDLFFFYVLLHLHWQTIIHKQYIIEEFV
jgi:hypothetical protein